MAIWSQPKTPYSANGQPLNVWGLLIFSRKNTDSSNFYFMVLENGWAKKNTWENWKINLQTSEPWSSINLGGDGSLKVQFGFHLSTSWCLIMSIHELCCLDAHLPYYMTSKWAIGCWLSTSQVTVALNLSCLGEDPLVPLPLLQVLGLDWFSAAQWQFCYKNFLHVLRKGFTP